MTDQCEGCGATGSTPHDSGCPGASVVLPDPLTDPRIQTFYDNAAAHGMTPGEYAVHLLGLPAILDVMEEARMEEGEEGQ